MSFVSLQVFPQEHFVSWLIRTSAFRAFADFRQFLTTENVRSDGMKPYDIFDHSVFALRKTNRGFEHEINGHTLIPFWQISLGKTVSKSASALQRVFETYSLVDEKTIFHFDFNWKSCPKCRSDDVHEYGTSYWHLEHQLPSLFSCRKHQCVLQKSSKPLRNLYGGVLPHHISKWQPLLTSTNKKLNDWQQFILAMYSMSTKYPDEFANIQARITSVLGMDDHSYEYKEKQCARLIPKFENEVGAELLEYLLKDYARHSKRGRFSVLHNLFVYNHRIHMVRSPVHWLLLAFWLKDELQL